MIGEAWPLPGILTFHFTSFSIDHSRGAFSSGTTPSPVGPRHPGHSPAELFAKRLKEITVFFKNFPLKDWCCESINQDKQLRFFKTHNVLGAINNSKFTNKKNTIGCIYVVRDPRNVLTSLQNHYEMSQEESLKFMLNENKFIYDHSVKNNYSNFQFISSWEKNYQSWINQKYFSVITIKYEDLINDTFETFKKVIEFIELIELRNQIQ